MIEVTPELERRLEAKAAKHGLNVQEYVRKMLEKQVSLEDGRGTTAVSPQDRAARVKAARGAFAHVPFSSEDAIRQKQEEIEREEQRWERRHK